MFLASCSSFSCQRHQNLYGHQRAQSARLSDAPSFVLNIFQVAATIITLVKKSSIYSNTFLVPFQYSIANALSNIVSAYGRGGDPRQKKHIIHRLTTDHCTQWWLFVFWINLLITVFCDFFYLSLGGIVLYGQKIKWLKCSKVWVSMSFCKF